MPGQPLALIVDDSKPIRSILGRMLHEMDFRVSEAANGREALERLRSEGPPAVATVNWNMPVMDGLEFLRLVRSDSQFEKLPVVMISSESDPLRISRAKSAGANAYLVKPCTKRILSTTLREIGVESSQGTSTIKVLVADDSVVVRRVVGRAVENDEELTLSAAVANGKLALEHLERNPVDVLILDIEMPVLNGLETLTALRESDRELGVILFSTHTERGAAITLDGLMRGADDYVLKPPDLAGSAVLANELIPKVKALGARSDPPPTPRVEPPAISEPSTKRKKHDLIAIGCSTGGPAALAKLIPVIAPNCPIPILVVQHMPPVFTNYLAKQLSKFDQCRVEEAVDGQQLEPGSVWIAPGGFHLEVQRRGGKYYAHVHQGALENGCRPSVDVLLRSCANCLNTRTLAVVLTGMGHDGRNGCELIRDRNGGVLVQDEQTSTIWGMPGTVHQAGLADEVLPLEEIGREILRRI